MDVVFIAQPLQHAPHLRVDLVVRQGPVRCAEAQAEGDAAEAGKGIPRLETIFKSVQAYWADKKVADATQASQAAVTALAEIQKALKANDMAAAETARGTLAQQCMGCHKEHREKLPEGGFRIK